jgi:hypothetical protein
VQTACSPLHMVTRRVTSSKCITSSPSGLVPTEWIEQGCLPQGYCGASDMINIKHCHPKDATAFSEFKCFIARLHCLWGFLFFNVLLACKSCTGGYFVTFTHVLQISFRFTPSIILPLPPPPFLEQFHSSIFIHEYKIHPSYSSSFTLSLCHPPPMVPTPGVVGKLFYLPSFIF